MKDIKKTFIETWEYYIKIHICLYKRA